MSFNMLLEVLRTLEALATEVALVRFQGYMDANVRGDVVAFDGRSMAISPRTHQVEVVRTLTAHMTIADVFLEFRCQCQAPSRLGLVLVLGTSDLHTHIKLLGTRGALSTSNPLTLQVIDGTTRGGCRRSSGGLLQLLSCSTRRTRLSILFCHPFLKIDERDPPPRPCRIGALGSVLYKDKIGVQAEHKDSISLTECLG